MADVPMALMTITIPGGTPGIERAAQALGVQAEAIDKTFGLVPIDPSRNLYAVQVRADALPQGETTSKDTKDASEKPAYRGPFSNPRIEPFGPRRR